MPRSIVFSMAALLPGALLLTYLAMHASEGWQLLVVAAFLLCFAGAWLRKSRALLVASYAMTVGLSCWVAWVNL